MSDRVRNIYHMFVSTCEFDDVSKNDYRHLPDGEAQFAIVRDVITKLEAYFADKSSGSREQAVELISVLIAAVKRKMGEYSAAARALDLDDAGFRRLFRIPNSNGADTVVAAGREFIEEITIHQAKFDRFGLLAADAVALGKDLDDLQAAVSKKFGAHSKKVGATAGIDDEIQRGMDAERFLDAMMKVVYRRNAAKLAEWKSARHVRRVDQPAPPENPPTE